jgi:hypothetical protein
MVGMKTGTIDRRRHRRWPLLLYLRVYDLDGDALLGHLVDLHTEGLMLVSSDPIPLGREFRLRLEMPAEVSAREPIRVHARSVRRNRDVNPDLFDTGFRMPALSPPQTARIKTLIKDLRVNQSLI